MCVTRAMLALLCALPLLGCGAGDRGTLALSWHFADGRLCTDAGAATVEARAESATLGAFACEAGEAPQAVMVGLPRGAPLDLFALSPARVELYRGALATDAALLPATVTLYATGSR